MHAKLMLYIITILQYNSRTYFLYFQLILIIYMMMFTGIKELKQNPHYQNSRVYMKNKMQ